MARRRHLPGLHPQLRRRQRRRDRRHRRHPLALPYLAELGVDAIWINPWYPSPMADAGYDVADYRDDRPAPSAPSTDAEALIVEAHEHGLAGDPRHRPEPHSTSTPGSGRRWPPAPAAPARRYIFRPGRGPTATSRPTTGAAASAARRGRGSRARRPGEWYLHLFAPEQPDLNWEQPRGARRVRVRSCGSGSTGASTGSASTSRTGWSRTAGCPTSARRRRPVAPAPRRRPPALGPRRGARDLPAPGGRSPTPTTAPACSSPRPGRARPSASPATSARTSCTPRSTSTSCVLPGGAGTCARSSTTPLDRARRGRRTRDLGAVQPRRRPPRHPLRPAAAPTGRQRLRCRTGPADADLELGTRRARAAALLMLALPGGAYVYQGEELGLPEVEDLPERRPAGPHLGALRPHRPRPRRLPGAAAVVRDSAAVRLQPGGRTAAPGCRSPEAWKALTAEGQEGDPASVLELYRSALRARRSTPRSATAR